MKKIQALTAVAAFFLASCGNTPAPAPTPTPTPTTTTKPADLDAYSVPATTPAALPAAKTIKVEGQLSEAADAGYPMGYISLIPTDKSPQVNINFNQEIDPVFKLEDLTKMLNKTVVVEYEDAAAYELLDVVVDKKAIFEYKGAILADAVKFTGTISAPAETTGDMPDDVTLKTADGQVITFQYFITPSLAAANGKTVDVVALVANKQSLKKISLAK